MTHTEHIEVLNQHTDEAHFATLPSEGFVNEVPDVEYVEAAFYERQALAQEVPTDVPATGAPIPMPQEKEHA